MTIITVDSKKEEITCPLKEVKQDEVFRFPHQPFDTCVEQNLFYRKLNDPSKNKDGRAYVSNLNGSEVRLFDDDRRVVVHRCDILVYRNEV